VETLLRSHEHGSGVCPFPQQGLIVFGPAATILNPGEKKLGEREVKGVGGKKPTCFREKKRAKRNSAAGARIGGGRLARANRTKVGSRSARVVE